MDDAISRGGMPSQAVGLVDRPEPHLGTRLREVRRLVRGPGQPDHLVASAQQLPHHRRPDEPRRSRHEHAHDLTSLPVVEVSSCPTPC